MREDKRKSINLDDDAIEMLKMFLLVDWNGTGIGYSEFIRLSVALWQNLPVEDIEAAIDHLHESTMLSKRLEKWLDGLPVCATKGIKRE